MLVRANNLLIKVAACAICPLSVYRMESHYLAPVYVDIVKATKVKVAGTKSSAAFLVAEAHSSIWSSSKTVRTIDLRSFLRH